MPVGYCALRGLVNFDPNGSGIIGAAICGTLMLTDIAMTIYVGNNAANRRDELQAEVDKLSCNAESIANNAEKIKELEAQKRQGGRNLAIAVGSGTAFGGIVGYACPFLIASPF